MVQVVLYCRCGGTLKAFVSPETAATLRQVWAGEHTTTRCAPTDARGAATARYLARRGASASSHGDARALADHLRQRHGRVVELSYATLEELEDVHRVIAEACDWRALRGAA